ncbi:hypothetical protein PRZ48_009107 [Zasmidium cellare]|uniref:Uncharacterized protein n=1 Tax=Zasmidium cellare TaxID=395010 RepID=A0ABR0EHE1_ZASCE|nr:hypothetical protein PRZ48_009107 [Zasmidium cellare]
MAPLLFITIWATVLTCISRYYRDISFNHVLLTMAGFVVGMSLSFRSTTTYERYIEGRKYWAQLILNSRNLARLIWIHTVERHEDSPKLGKQDVLQKLAALNLLTAFAVALKHHLIFEPSVDYPDLALLVAHLNTFADEADQIKLHIRQVAWWHSVWHLTDLSVAQSNPLKYVKQSKPNLGNTPLENLTYLSCYYESVNKNGTLKNNLTAAQTIMSSLVEVLTGSERIVNTPLPIAYSISISQIMWAYVLSLPFQLYERLGLVTIPGTIIAGYIILGLAGIGRELENPSGYDVNDLPLDSFCQELASDIDVLTSSPPPLAVEEWTRESGAQVMWPFSGNYRAWEARSMEEIRTALKVKAVTKDATVERARCSRLSRLFTMCDAPLQRSRYA